MADEIKRSDVMEKNNKISLKLCLLSLIGVGALLGSLATFCIKPSLNVSVNAATVSVSSENDLGLVQSGNWTYRVGNDNTATLVSYNVMERYIQPSDEVEKENIGENGLVEIPAVIDGHKVIALGDMDAETGVFGSLNYSIVSLKFSSDCEITTINRLALSNLSALSELIIPTSVNNIAEDAFKNDYQLTSIVVADDNEKFTSVNGVLYSKEMDELILYPASKLGDCFEVPSTVEKIGSYAFSHSSNLSLVALPNSLKTIGSYAFEDCDRIINLFIPDSVTNIGSFAFSGCDMLTTVVMPQNEKFITINEGTFLGCGRLTFIDIPTSVKIIGSKSFNSTQVKSIVIPKSVTRIGVSAFENDDMLVDVEFEHDKLPNDFLGNQAFYTSEKMVVTLNGEDVYKEMVKMYSNTKVFTNAPDCFKLKGTKVQIGDITLYTRIGDSKYYLDGKCTQVFDERIPIVRAEGEMFNGFWTKENGQGKMVVDCNGKLQEVITEDDGKAISLYPYWATGTNSEWSFEIEDGEARIFSYNGKAVADLKIPAYLKDEQGNAFPVTSVGVNCTKQNNIYNNDSAAWKELVNLSLPSTVKSIAPYAFYKCTNLKTISFDGVESIGNYAFYTCRSLTKLTLTSSVKTVGMVSFRSCTNLEELVICEGVEKIRDYAFYGCSKLTKVVLPKSMTAIGKNSFGCCNNLRSIDIDKSLVIAEFDENPTQFVINEQQDKIVASDFNDAKTITSIIVAEKNTHFKAINGLLYSADGRKLIRCPAGFTGVVKLPSGVTEIGDYAFNGCSKVTEIKLNRSIRKIGKWAFAWCESLTTITIPQLTHSIGDYAFKNCSLLTEVIFKSQDGKGVIKLGNYVFEFCEKLNHVVLPETLKKIGAYAFANCVSLAQIDLPQNLTNLGCGVFRNSGIENIVLPTNAEFDSIEFNTFGFCNKLTTVYIPANIKSIGSHAFSWCDNLSLVTFATRETVRAETAFSRTAQAVKLEIVVEE